MVFKCNLYHILIMFQISLSFSRIFLQSLLFPMSCWSSHLESSSAPLHRCPVSFRCHTTHSRFLLLLRLSRNVCRCASTGSQVHVRATHDTIRGGVRWAPLLLLIICHSLARRHLEAEQSPFSIFASLLQTHWRPFIWRTVHFSWACVWVQGHFLPFFFPVARAKYIR